MLLTGEDSGVIKRTTKELDYLIENVVNVCENNEISFGKIYDAYLRLIDALWEVVEGGGN